MNTISILSKRSCRILFLLLICYFSFFINNRLIYADIMESRNLVTAREIVADGNWLIPTMNGELRLEKPPLPTWVAACIEILSSDNLPLQRAAAGCMATLLVFFLYAFTSRQTQSWLFGVISAVVLCTSFNIILMGRTATWDIYCHSFMLGAIYFIFRGVQQEGKNWGMFIWAGIFLGLSFLGKGPVSFYALLIPFLLAYGIVYRPSLKRKWIPIIVMIVICLMISFWWPILLYFTHKEVLLSVWNKESTAWLTRSVKPWYYYWKFFVETGVWALFLVTGLIWPYWKKRFQFKKAYLFSVCWVFMILICLSLLPEKKNRYLLPILLPSALVVAHLFWYWWQNFIKGSFDRKDRITFRVNTLLIAAIVCLLPLGIYLVFFISGQLRVGNFIYLSIILEVIAGCLFYFSFKNRALGFLGGILLLFLCVEIFILPSIVSLFNNPDLKSIQAVRHIQKLDNVPFYYNCSEELRIEIVYEAGRKILPYCFQENEDLPTLPFVLVSYMPAEEVLPEEILEKVDLELIGIYDDNKRTTNSRLHSAKFVRRVTLVNPKE